MEFRRARTAKEKQAISQGLKVFWDKEGRKPDSKEKQSLSGKQKLAIGIGAIALAGGGLAIAAKKGKLKVPGFSQKIEPYRATKYLPQKASLGIGQSEAFTVGGKKGFFDTAGKFRQKGKMLPGLKKGQNTHLSVEPNPGFIQKKKLDFPIGGFKSARPSRTQTIKNVLSSTQQNLVKAAKKTKQKVDQLTPYATKTLKVGATLAGPAAAGLSLARYASAERVRRKENKKQQERGLSLRDVAYINNSAYRLKRMLS